MMCAFALYLSIGLGKSQMVRNDSIGNDPALEKLCVERARSSRSLPATGELQPFEIDSKYVARVRKDYPDTTFIMLNLGVMECSASSGTFQPVGLTDKQQWRRLDEPKEPVSLDKAGNLCREAARIKINLPNFDGSSLYTVGPGFGRTVGSIKGERYDVWARGVALYKTSGPDKKKVDFSCLLSPALEIKAVEFK